LMASRWGSLSGDAQAVPVEAVQKK